MGGGWGGRASQAQRGTASALPLSEPQASPDAGDGEAARLLGGDGALAGGQWADLGSKAGRGVPPGAESVLCQGKPLPRGLHLINIFQKLGRMGADGIHGGGGAGAALPSR